MRIIAVTASGAAPIGIASGSMITSSRAIPCRSAFSTIFAAAANRTSGSIEIPVSSFAIPITAAPWAATSGRSRSIECCSAVTELISTLPPASGTAASSASGVEESMQIGTSTSSFTILTISESIADLVEPGDAGVEVEYPRAGLDLRDRVGPHGVVDARLQFLGELASGPWG